MTGVRTARRIGMSALIPFVALVLGGAFAFLLASHFASSNAALAGVRAYDLRLAIDACRTSLDAAMVQIKARIDANAPLDGAPGKWREMLTPSLRSRDRPLLLIPVAPALRRHFEGLGIYVTDVRAGVAEVFDPPYQGAASLDALQFPPQGTIGVAVTATVSRGNARVIRTMTERWVFAVSATAAAKASGKPPSNLTDDVVVTILPAPVARMVQL